MLTIVGTTTQAQTSTKICSASDLHYFAPSLLVNDGTAFQTYLAQDRKLIAESKAITAALVAKINEEKPEILVVTGDLTKDGERQSHLELAKYLDTIEMNGITKVFVVPGNHDVNNIHAYSYDGANKTRVDSISPADFKTIYKDFGYSEATDVDSISLTYLAKPSSNIWILGIDACMYDSNMVRNEPVTEGRFKPATYKWILDRLVEAKTAGATVIGLMHHGATEHYTGQSVNYSDYVVAGWDTISKNFANAGLKLMFTGHYHANDITLKKGTGSNFIYDIETGSTVTWPCPYRVMTLNSNNLFNITTKYIIDIAYNTNGKSFQDYAKETLTNGLNVIVNYTLKTVYSLDDATATALTPHVVNAYVAHYSGDEKMPADEKSFIAYLTANKQTLFASMLATLWTDLTPADNNLMLDLNVGTTKQSVQFVYTSDAHYGITRSFRGIDSVPTQTVNASLVEKINSMPFLQFPADNGVNAGSVVGGFNYLIETGDIANRQEAGIQSASASWAQFKTDYIDGLTLTDNYGKKAGLLLTPGNHDVSNAIGYYKTMSPLKDSATMVNIYNMMMPSPRPAGTYNYTNEKIHYSRNIGGVHFMFVNMWPDSSERVWMEKDLKTINITTPVVIFTHDQPDVESKHFTNPNGSYNINSTDKFENLLTEIFKDGNTIKAPSTIEQRGFTQFVKAHRNIVAYFHGNDNDNEYYTYRGTDSSIALNTIRIDSPMKGNISGSDETKLSFQTISIDTVTRQMTVRECLWNTVPSTPSTPVVFGASKTFNLGVAQNLVAYTNTLVDTNYTVPSWTLMKKAAATALSLGDSTSIANLNIAIAELTSKQKPYCITANINGNPTTQMGFAWFTNVGVKGGKVVLVEGSTNDASVFATPAFTFAATCDSVVNLNYNVKSNELSAFGIADNTKKSYMSNKALATGLKPNTTYSYRVGKEDAWSEIGTFTTAKDNKEAFSFVYFTDPQANTEDMFNISQKTTHAAQKMYPDANFWLTGGDLIETSGSTNSEWEYEQFFASQQDIWYNKPFAPITGNHDKSANKNFTYHFNTANPTFDKTMATTPGSVYSFVYGDALFMALSYEDYSKPGYLDSLAKWMRAEVNAHPEVKWRVAFYHKTMYTGSQSHQSDADGKAVRERMAPLFDSLKIDVAMQGHDHIYEIMGPIKKNSLIPGVVTKQIDTTEDSRSNVTGLWGGTFDLTEGTLYFLNNSAGKKKYEPRTKTQMDTVEASLGVTNYFDMFTGRFGQTGEPTFSNVTVSTDTIKVSTYTVNDAGVATLFDEFKITKTVHVASVTLDKHDIKAFPARHLNIETIVLPIPAINKSLVWTSSDSSVAIATNGMVTTFKPGMAKIYAISIDGGIKDSCVITVVAPQARYVRGDFHQHTTYTDGSYSFAHMMDKNNQFGLDWWANSEHGGAFNRDGENSGVDSNQTIYFDSYNPNPILGTTSSSSGHQNMWRWQTLSQFEYPNMVDAREKYITKTLLQSFEWNVPGHEHGSMGLIANQFDANNNCEPLAQFEFMFDANDVDLTGGVAKGWTKSTKSGHEKTIEGINWLQTNYATQSYVVPAHPERQKKYKINHFRDMNNAGPDVCFGFESMPGHQKDPGRGGYSKTADGGGTYGGCGIYAAKVGGLWDAMLSEGRNFWLFANSDCHFEDGDFYPGEYQKNYTYATNNSDAQSILNGLRSGNTWVVEGDLIDSLIFEVSPASNSQLTASMGQTLQLTEKGATISIKVRDPQGVNHNTYSSYNKPVLHHLDIIMGKVTGKLDPSDPRYNIDNVTTTSVIARFDANGLTTDANGLKSTAWTDLGDGWREMTLDIDDISDSVYFRLRATNLALGVTNETDFAGNPLSDTLAGANNAEKAFADLWMYSNPVFVNQTKVYVDSITTSGKDTIIAGNSSQFVATVYPSNATNKNVTWKSSNDEIATVTDGEVKGISAGTTVISATTEDGAHVATMTILVIIPVASINLSAEKINLLVNDDSTLTATIEPTNTTITSVKWHSLNDTIATVSNGIVTAKRAGSTKIVVTSSEGNKTDTCIVTVNNFIPVTGLTLSSTALKLEPGKTEKSTATITPANATVNTVTWITSNAQVATVENGVITALKVGTAVISAISNQGNKVATCIVTVSVQPTTITLNHTTLELEEGTFLLIHAEVTPRTTTNPDLLWTSTNPEVATVENGVITAVSAGYTTISVRTEEGNVSEVCKVTIKASEQTTSEEITTSEETRIFPIIATDKITCEFPTSSGPVDVNVISAKGETIQSFNSEGKNLIVIDIDSYPRGIYFITFTINGNKTTKHFVKK